MANEVFYTIYDTVRKETVLYYKDFSKAEKKAFDLNNGKVYYLQASRYNIGTQSFAD